MQHLLFTFQQGSCSAQGERKQRSNLFSKVDLIGTLSSIYYSHFSGVVEAQVGGQFLNSLP